MATPNGMHNLTTLIKRLEAATSRLEDMATSIDYPPPALGATTAPAPPAAAPGVAAVAPAPPPPPAPTAEPLPLTIEEFDKIIDGEVGDFVKASEKIGGVVEEQSKAFKAAFEAERTFLYVATKSKKPDPLPMELMTELHRASDSISNIRESNRPSPLFNHLSAVAEGIVAIGWFFETRPVDFVKEAVGGAQMYGNRVLKEYKEKDITHVQYIQAYYKIFKALQEFIQQHYARGLVWNATGVNALDALKEIQSGSAAAPAAGGAAPPPPPPPPLPVFDNIGGAPPPPPMPAGGAPKAAGGDISAVFDQINQGSSVTAGLRKVDKSEMTHKNPSLRAGNTVPERSNSQGSIGSSASRGKSPLPSKKPKPEAMRVKKPPRKQLEGSKWIVENFENTGSDIIEIPAQLSHSILISRCNKAIIKVNSKANAISIDNCNSLSIIVDSLVSSIDIIKAPKFALQVDGVVPTILLDQVDGAQIYLSKQSLGVEILTSKCSSINVTLPPADEDGDDKECAVPEQFRTYIKDGVLISEIVEHAG